MRSAPRFPLGIVDLSVRDPVDRDPVDRLPRQMHPRTQAALRRCLELHVAAMATRCVAGDRQAETDAPGRRIAGRIEPDEWPKHPSPVGSRNAGSVVVDEDIDAVLHDHPGEPDMAAVAARIAEQVAQAAAQGIGPDRHHIFGRRNNG